MCWHVCGVFLYHVIYMCGVCVCVYIYIYIYIYMYVCVNVYVCMYAYVFVCVCIYIYIYMHGKYVTLYADLAKSISTWQSMRSMCGNLFSVIRGP